MTTTIADPGGWGARLAALLTHPAVVRAVACVRTQDERTLTHQVELSQIAAPPFGESARGRRTAELMGEEGLVRVATDEVGNVLGWMDARRTSGAADSGRLASGALVLSAHLDTVFPEGTDVTVHRDGDVLRGPGICDDARGLATLLALARALGTAGVRTARPILFAATVGEEGIGDLRGVRYLFGQTGAARSAAGFVSLDGAGIERVVVRGLGSRRFRITATGPGGHSWVDFGTPNPIHALAGVAERLASLSLSADPPTTLTLARWGGGTSVNAIPQEAWIEIDTRCEDERRLADGERELSALVAEASIAEPGLAFEVRSLGTRPAGATPLDTPLVQATLAATRAVGGTPDLAVASTDANVPMSLGVPAVTVGCGGDAGKTHTTDEWYRNVRGVEGVLRALYLTLLAAGVER